MLGGARKFGFMTGCALNKASLKNPQTRNARTFLPLNISVVGSVKLDQKSFKLISKLIALYSVLIVEVNEARVHGAQL